MRGYVDHSLTPLSGIPLGIFQSMTCVYAIEVMPTCLRGYLTSYVNVCWVSIPKIAAQVHEV